MKIERILWAILATSAFLFLSNCKNLSTTEGEPETSELIDLNNGKNASQVFIIDFEKGENHNHPLMAIWAEDVNGKYIETFFVSQSIGKGVFDKVIGGGGKWLPGPVRRPAALPYWAHKRGVKESDGLYIPTPQTPMPDAIAGATPRKNFRLVATPVTPNFPRIFHLLLEINQSWDWNSYWTNSKFPDEPEYKTSSQPSVVYSAFINLDDATVTYNLNPIGHGHYAGKTGELFTDLSTLTTALEIAKRITVTVRK
jgi:hypothetical protein